MEDSGGAALNSLKEGVMENEPVRSRAFSIVELLVVIAVISVLAALLLPSLERSMLLGKAMACKNQLKQQFCLLTAYTMDHGEYLPDSPAEPTTGIFHFSSASNMPDGYPIGMGKLVPGYMGGSIELLSCPSRTAPNAALWKGIVDSNYKAGTAASWKGNYGIWDVPYEVQYGRGWSYGPGWTGGKWNFQPQVFSSNSALALRNLKPTLGNYSRGGRTVLLADADPLWTNAFSAGFHNQGEIQNTLMYDGTIRQIDRYWDILRPYMNYCWSYSNQVYWHVGQPSFCWWGCFGNGTYSK